MGKQNKNPGKRWQELLGLSAVPYFGQDTIPYEDEDEEEFIFNPETMSLINPIDIESGLYNKNAFEEGLYTPMYDEEGVFLGYAYNNDDFTYLDAFLTNQNYNIRQGDININKEKQQVTSQSVSEFISNEFTDATEYELSFTYEVSGISYRNVILYGFDSDIQNGYKIGTDIPSKTGLCIETFVDGEMTNRDKYNDTGLNHGIYSIKIIRKDADADIYIDNEKIGSVDNVERNTLGLWKWGGGSSSIRDIFLKEITEEPAIEPEKVDISVTVTDGKDPIESVSVTLTANESTVSTGNTGSAGGCTLSNVPLGSYIVTASKTGYTEYTDTLTVTKETTTLAITMSVAEAEPEVASP